MEKFLSQQTARPAPVLQYYYHLIFTGNPVTGNAEISWKLQKGSDGRTFVHVEKFYFDFEPKTFKLHFHDKDHGGTQLGKRVAIVHDLSL